MVCSDSCSLSSVFHLVKIPTGKLGVVSMFHPWSVIGPGYNDVHVLLYRCNVQVCAHACIIMCLPC